MRSRTRGAWRGRKISSYILRQATSWVQFSIKAVDFCVYCASVFMFVCVVLLCNAYMGECVCISSTRSSQQDPGTGIPADQDLTEGADGALWGVLSAQSPDKTMLPNPPHIHHSLHFIHNSQLCTDYAIPLKELIFILWYSHSLCSLENLAFLKCMVSCPGDTICVI